MIVLAKSNFRFQISRMEQNLKDFILFECAICCL